MIKFKRNAVAGVIAIGLILKYVEPVSAISLFANVDDYVHIRTSPSIQSDIIGYMFNNDMAHVIEQDPITGWMKVRSGNIIGWVDPNYFIQDNLFARGKVTAVVKNDNLNIYSCPTEDSFSIENELKFGDIVSCVDNQNGWVTIKLQDESFGFIKRTDCYINPIFELAKNQLPLEFTQPIQPIETIAITPVNEYEEQNIYIQEEQNFENPVIENQIIVQQSEQIIEENIIYEETPASEEQIIYDDESLVNEEVVYYDGNIVTEDYYNYVNSESYYQPEQLVDNIEVEQSTYVSNISNSDIVSYADQFVGNPYVWGGNSLTEGIDCSHFVWQVLSNTGHYDGDYAVSDGWASLGTDVGSLENAVAGDVIVYPGHVAIYDGEGGIVEAKGQEWGITHDRSADSGEILAIRHFD